MKDDAFTVTGAPHHPGVNARPSGGLLAEVVDAAESASGLDDPAIVRAWRYGVFLVNQRYFWEAHEALEPVWMAAPPNSRERYLVQGLIQLANACLKADMARLSAAFRLLDLADGHLADAASGGAGAVLGVHIDACLSVSRAVRAALQSGGDWQQAVILDLPSDEL